MKMETWSGQSLKQLADGFIAAGESIPEMMMGKSEVDAYNKAVRVMSEIATAMQALGDEGRQALITLMGHKNVAVRARAASACREFARDRAVAVLSDVCELRAGQMSMDAMHSLMAMGAFDMKSGPMRPPR